MRGHFVRDYRDLRVWQSAMMVARQVFQLCQRLPGHQRYALAIQMQRASVSIAANIAEGNGRCYKGDYVRFLSIARGSAFELATLLELTVLAGFLSESDVARTLTLLRATTMMLTKLLVRIRAAVQHVHTDENAPHSPFPITDSRF